MIDGQHPFKYFESRRQQMVDLISELVDIESPSFDSAASRRVADRIEALALAVHSDAEIDRVSTEQGDHLLVRCFAGDGPRTLLLGHTDTVHPVGTREKNPTRVDGGRLYGCGVFDMKANIVLALEVLRYFSETGERPAGPVTFLLSCDEEVGSRSGRPLVEREAAAAGRCFVLEPSADGRVKTGRKGTGMYTLRARGIPSHAGLEPEKGANAVVELAHQIPRIQDLGSPAAGTTVNVTTFHGGTASNVIPDLAECQIDVRFSTMAEGERVDGCLQDMSPVEDRVSLELDGGINRPPLERTDAVAALYERARGLAASFGYELGETQVGGASDGNFVGAMGVPVLDGLGITGAGAHTLDEYILISDIAPRAALLTLLLSGS